MASSAILAAGVWLILAALYVLFAGSLDTSEIIAGLPATLLATAFVMQRRQTQSRRMRLAAPWWRVIGAPIAALLPDAVRVGGMLLRALVRRPGGPVGSMSRQAFRHGDDAAASAGRRAMVTLALSLAPNGYVVDLPDGQDVLVLHRLVPAAPSADTDWPL